jgi:hypothetical protein
MRAADALFRRLNRILPRIAEKVQAQSQQRQAQAQEQHTVNGDTPPTGKNGQDDAPYCHLHDMPLKRYTKEGRAWLSHYDSATHAWCRGK